MTRVSLSSIQDKIKISSRLLLEICVCASG